MARRRVLGRLLGRVALVGSVLVFVGCGSDGEKANDGAPAAAATADKKADVKEADVKVADSREGWPTEEEAKAAIFKVEYAIQASQTNKDVWHVKDMKHEVHSVTFANRTTEKQMHYGDGAITVYPAKILYTRIVEYTDKEATREELGADGVWLFYQDSFGEWTGKYGSE